RIATILRFSRFPRWLIRAVSGLLTAAGQKGLVQTVHNFGHRDTAHYWHLVERQMAYQQHFLKALDEAQGGPFDLILCPASALPALTHGASDNLGTAGGYTTLYNVLG